jgi:hypothetical protein
VVQALDARMPSYRQPGQPLVVGARARPLEEIARAGEHPRLDPALARKHAPDHRDLVDARIEGREQPHHAQGPRLGRVRRGVARVELRAGGAAGRHRTGTARAARRQAGAPRGRIGWARAVTGLGGVHHALEQAVEAGSVHRPIVAQGVRARAAAMCAVPCPGQPA